MHSVRRGGLLDAAWCARRIQLQPLCGWYVFIAPRGRVGGQLHAVRCRAVCYCVGRDPVHRLCGLRRGELFLRTGRTYALRHSL